jgi:plasmid stabilization system protein ParE
MTDDQMEAVLNRVRTWPRDCREDAVRVLLTLERRPIEPYVLDSEDAAEIDAALAEIARGEEPASMPRSRLPFKNIADAGEVASSRGAGARCSPAIRGTENPAAGKAIVGRLEETTHHLTVFPELGHPTNVAGVRTKLIPGYPYRLFYTIFENRDEI